ncbi:MAG: hypothetical protein IJ547_04155, partial [Clostridia bacterium]|nr:hypothetical protein [Clostridia bacterium]
RRTRRMGAPLTWPRTVAPVTRTALAAFRLERGCSLAKKIENSLDFKGAGLYNNEAVKRKDFTGGA